MPVEDEDKEDKMPLVRAPKLLARTLTPSSEEAL